MSSEQRLQTAIELAVLIGGTVCSAVIHPAAAVVTAAAGIIILAVQTFFSSRRSHAVLRICDEIGKVLHGAEEISLRSFEEGELSILSAEIQKMTIKLREQNAALKKEQQFSKEALEDLSHQLRTPLTSLMLVLDLMRAPNLPKAQQEENFYELQMLLSRMQWLIETLLGLSRMEAGDVHFQQEQICCRSLIAAALEPISVALELKEIRVETAIAEDAVFFGDLPYCTEALLNLLKNCMEHTPAGGVITVSAETNAVYTGIRITDSGPGIAAEDLPHLFERFYRGGSFSKSGYGIGLAFARRIITAQNGSIQVRNTAPHGAEFDIRFYRTAV